MTTPRPAPPESAVFRAHCPACLTDHDWLHRRTVPGSAPVPLCPEEEPRCG